MIARRGLGWLAALSCAAFACGAPAFDLGDYEDDEPSLYGKEDGGGDAQKDSGPAAVADTGAPVDAGTAPATNPTSTTAGLTEQQIAQKIVASKKIKSLPYPPDYYPQIVDIANGKTVPNCGIDIRILKLIFKLTEKFDSVGISDINRKCTGVLVGAGTASAHYINGGGHAVDFWRLNGTNLNGSNAIDIEMLNYIAKFMPTGTRVGQANCRSSAGKSVNLPGITQFSDTCNHQHVDVGTTNSPFKD